MKKMICILVLAVSGNTFGSFSVVPAVQVTPGVPALETTSQIVQAVPALPADISGTAATHFQPLMQGLPATDPIILQAKSMGEKYMIHPTLQTQHLKQIQNAYNAGVKAGITTAGKYMQAGLNAMTPVATTPTTK